MTTTLDNSRPPATNWAVLAGLRFFLAWVVLSGHISWFTPDSGRLFRFFDSFGGKPAVIGFLMVSGYSIAASLRKNVRGFYRRRLIRLYPLYFFSLIAAVGLQVPFKEVPTGMQLLHSSDPVTVVGNFLFLQTFLVKPIAYDPIVWSLSIEFAYCLAYLCPLLGDRGIVIFVINKFNALKYLWAWLLGFVCFWDRRPVILIGLAAIGTILVALLNTETLALLTFGLSFLLLNVSGMITTRKTLANILNYLGELSYPLYLVHFLSFIVGVQLMGITNRWTLAALALLTTVISYHVIDIYCKKKFFVPIIDAASVRLHLGLNFVIEHRTRLQERKAVRSR
jgi:peptidoglycan/LPS O-acetylase OafA/YrhL